MKRILTILFLWAFAAHAQTKDVYLLGEYHAAIIRAVNHSYYECADGLATLDASAPNGAIWTGSAGPHDIYVVDTAGQVWGKGDNTYGELGDNTTTTRSTFVRASLDSLGNNFRDVVQLCASSTGVGWMVAALKKDGTVWICGRTDGWLRGNNTAGGECHRFVQITMPETITKIQIGFFGMVLGASGKVYTWGGQYPSSFYAPYLLSQGTATPNYGVPTQIAVITAPVIDIASNGQTAYALTANNWGSGQLYGWAYWFGSTGVGSTVGSNSPQNPSAPLSPSMLDTAWSAYVPANFRIRHIWAGSLTTYVIDSVGSVYGQGDNSNGGYGNGDMIYWATYPSPYNWNQQYGDSARTFYRKPRLLSAGKTDWDTVMTGPALVFAVTLRDKNNNLFGMGRNKDGTLANNNQPADAGNGNMSAIYPNSWMVPWLTRFTPFFNVSAAISTSPICKSTPGATWCSTWPWDGSKAGPTANAGPDQTIFGTTSTLQGTKSVASGVSGVLQVVWSQVSGPVTANIPYQYDSVPISGLSPGNYVFRMTVTDTNFKTGTDDVAFTVYAPNSFAIPAGVIKIGSTRGRIVIH